MEIAVIGLSVLNITFIVVFFKTIREHDKTVMDLATRLASRNQSEYLATKTYASKPPDDTPPERMSWYDDPVDDE